MDWTNIICIYAAGLLVIPTAFGICCSREISRGRLGQDDYIIFIIFLMIWPLALILAALCGIGCVIGCTPYIAVKWWMWKCAKLTESWKEHKRQNELEREKEKKEGD